MQLYQVDKVILFLKAVSENLISLDVKAVLCVLSRSSLYNMSHAMGKLAFCICENKEAVTAKLICVFVLRYLDSTIPLLSTPKISKTS